MSKTDWGAPLSPVQQRHSPVFKGRKMALCSNERHHREDRGRQLSTEAVSATLWSTSTPDTIIKIGWHIIVLPLVGFRHVTEFPEAALPGPVQLLASRTPSEPLRKSHVGARRYSLLPPFQVLYSLQELTFPSTRGNS